MVAEKTKYAEALWEFSFSLFSAFNFSFLFPEGNVREGESVCVCVCVREREALEECQYDWRGRGVCVRCASDNNSSPAVLFHAHSHDPLLPLTCTAVCECERRPGD